MSEIPATFETSVLCNSSATVVHEVLTQTQSMSKWLYDDVISLEKQRDGQIILKAWMHGEIFEVKMRQLHLSDNSVMYSQWSSLSGWEDIESERTLLHFNWNDEGEMQKINLVQNNFKTFEEYAHVRFYWSVTMPLIGQVCEMMMI